jgi:hypothetical protein
VISRLPSADVLMLRASFDELPMGHRRLAPGS